MSDCPTIEVLNECVLKYKMMNTNNKIKKMNKIDDKNKIKKTKINKTLKKIKIVNKDWENVENFKGFTESDMDIFINGENSMETEEICHEKQTTETESNYEEFSNDEQVSTNKNAKRQKLSNITSPNNTQLKKKESEMNKQNITHYTTKDKPPYFVIAYKQELKIIKLGKDLESVGLKNIDNIFQLGKNKAKIQFSNISEANKILRNQQIKDLLGYEFSIPEIHVKTIGVIRNIPTDITIEEISKSIEVEKGVEIIGIDRIKRWNFNERKEEDTELVKIIFRANYLPSRVKIFNTIQRTQYYFPKPFFCTNCLRYGHLKKYCKSETKCRICSELMLDNKHNCTGIEKCNLCSNKHKTNDKDCEFKKTETKITKLMILQKKSYAAAKKIIINDNPIRQFNINQENFPQLKTTNNYNLNKNDSINNINSEKYTEITKVLKKKDTLLQVTAQIIQSLYNEKNPGAIDEKIIKLLDIFKNHTDTLEKFDNY